MKSSHWMECRQSSKLNALTRIFIFILTLNFPFLSYSQNFDWENAIQSKSRKIDGDFYFAGLEEIAEVLNAHTYYSNKVRKAILYLGEKKVTVTAHNPFVLSGRKVLQMPVSTKYANGDILVPVKFFVPILKLILSNSITDKLNGATLDGIATEVNIFGVQVEEKANGTLIRVSTLDAFDKANISTRYSRKWLYLDILGGKINRRSFFTKVDPGLVSKVVPVQLEQMVQLSFQLKRDISGKEFNSSQRANEIWVSIPAKESLSSDIIKKLKDDQKKWRIDKIVIDPGHGGRDPGTIGHNGIYEKNVVLAIAKRLKKLLEKKLDVEVLMTRETDKYVSLKERTQFANKKQGKLFISIHANWNRNSKVTGATTYFLGLAKSEESLEIAQRENAVIKYDNGNSHYNTFSDEQIILAAMAQNSYNKESQDFAAMIQEKLKERSGIRDRGVKQAGFYVLVGASMPNVLVETAFMSNRREERLLNSRSFQEKVATAIFESIKKFKEKYEWTMKTN